MLASPVFANAPAQQRFLRFIVEEALAGRGGELKEFVVATEVLGRGADYDPHHDATVRVAARRLRDRLREYYDGDGRHDAVRIVLHAGSYRPTFEYRPSAPDLEAPSSDRPPALDAVPGSEAPAGPAPAATDGRALRRLTMAALVGVAIVTVAGAGWWLAVRRDTGPQVVAVLPFANATGDPANDIVCFGLVEELTTQLAQRTGLRVVARTSAMQFAGQGDVREAARRLGATAIVEGSLRGDGNRWRVSAQLIRASDGAHVWAHTYDRASDEPLAMQDAVAREVAADVANHLAAGREPVATRPALPASAVSEYWRGRYQRSLRTADGRRAALAHFEAAIAAAPSYAEAYAAAGEVLATMAFHAEIPTEEGLARARAASQRAIDLDPTLGLAHATLGWIAFFHDRDWSAAERAYRHALDLNPSDATARQMFAHGLASRARFEDAIAESEAAAGLDPLSFAASADLAVVLYLARRFDECVARAQRAVDTFPQATHLRGILGVCEIARGRVREGRTHLETLAAELGQPSFALGRLAQACAAEGDTARARALAAELEAMATRGDGAYVHLALALTALGDHARALEALATAVERREGDTVFLAVEPAFDPLRRDPRFVDLLRRLRLPV